MTAGLRLVLLIFLSMSMASCGQGLRGNQASSQPWTVGFWLWQGAEFDVAAAGNRPFDVLYVQVGRVDSYWKNSVSWPLQAQMPPAKEFWALWRYDPPARPAEAQIPVIAGDFTKRRAEAAGRGQTLVGVQLDYDCPTGDLAEYASFLEKLGKALPAGARISITALLDWFRAGTKISEVLAHASEFVPQFYDAAMSPEGRLRAIAEPIDAARWGPVFNSFKIPYRVGISTFGRITYKGTGGARNYRELTPLDILGLPGLKNISSGPTPGGEQRTVFQAQRPLKLNIYFNDLLWQRMQIYVFLENYMGRFGSGDPHSQPGLTRSERTTILADDRRLRDEQEERWKAYHVLEQVAREAGHTELGRKAALKIIECLGAINTGSFGRGQEIGAAIATWKRWLSE